MSKRGGPRGSELVVQDWLQRRSDLVDVRFVGDAGLGPPDFLPGSMARKSPSK